MGLDHLPLRLGEGRNRVVDVAEAVVCVDPELRKGRGVLREDVLEVDRDAVPENDSPLLRQLTWLCEFAVQGCIRTSGVSRIVV